MNSKRGRVVKCSVVSGHTDIRKAVYVGAATLYLY